MKILEVEEATKNWLDQYVSSSRRVYRMALTTFIDFLEETEGSTWTPKRIVEERLNDLDNRTFSFEQKIIDFFKWLQNYETPETNIPFTRKDPKTGKIINCTFHRKSGKKLSDNTKQGYVNGVRSFFAYNRLDLKLTTQQKRLIGKKARLVQHDYCLSLMDIGKMAEVGTPQERFVLLAGKDLGLRAIDFVNLKQGAFARVVDQNKNSEPPFFLGETYTQKEGVTAYPFLTLDGLDASRVWLQVLETKGLRDDDAPMLNIRKKELTTNLRRMATKAGVDTHGQRIRFHCLRKFLADKLSLRMSESKWKQIVGKQIDEGAYIGPSDLREGYANVLDRIQIPTHTETNHVLVKEIEEKNLQLQVLVNSLASENQSMKNEVFEMKNELDALKKEDRKTKENMKKLEGLLSGVEQKILEMLNGN